MSITSIFNRGLDGLNVNSRGLAVTSNNIANMNTKGYARQEIVIGARAGQGVFGGGAEVIGVNAIVSPFVEMQLFHVSNDFGTADGRRQTVGQLESIWNDSQTTGVGKAINDFFNSFSELASDPANIAIREGVKSQGSLLAEKIRTMAGQFNTMRQNVSSELDSRLDIANDSFRKIAELNRSITALGGPEQALDLVAQRQEVLRSLSEEMNVTYYVDSNGLMNLQLAGGQNVVAGYSYGSLGMTDDLSAGGDATITVTPANSTDVLTATSQFTGGRIAGLLIDRNTTLNDQIDKLDQLAYTLVNQINTLHSTGYGLDGSTNNNFFGPLGSATGAASAIDIDASISDVRKIAAATQDPAVSGVSDNRMAKQLFALQNTNVLSSGTESFAGYYQARVGEIGVLAGSVENSYNSQSNLLNNMQIQRESVSGVNMDEEGANIIRFQKAFQASSRLLQIADDLMDEILKI